MNRQPEQTGRDAPGGGRASLLVRLIGAFGWAGIAALLVPTVLICADIVWRRAIGGAFMDTFDITKLCLVAVAAWSIPYGFVHGSHVSVGILVERLPARAQILFDGVIHTAAALLFALLGWFAWHAAALHVSYHDTTQNLGIPVIYYWVVFLVGLALTILACLWRAARALRGWLATAGEAK